METDIDKSIDEIKEKLRAFVKNQNKVRLAQGLHINKNYFADLSKKKTFTITELALFSEIFKYDFFALIDLKVVRGETEIPKREKRATISVTIEVEDIEKERKILESILDKSAVKKLLG